MILSPNEHWQCLYAMKLQILQENVGLTFGEAKLYLYGMEWHNLSDFISLKLGIPENTPEHESLYWDLTDEYERISRIVGDKPERVFGRFQDGYNGDLSGGDFDVTNPEEGLYDVSSDIDLLKHPRYRRTNNSASKSKVWYYGEFLTKEEFRQVRYAKRLWFLQGAGFSYADARLYLHRERPEALEDLSLLLSEDSEILKNRFAEICAEVEAMLEKEDIFHGHTSLIGNKTV